MNIPGYQSKYIMGEVVIYGDTAHIIVGIQRSHWNGITIYSLKDFNGRTVTDYADDSQLSATEKDVRNA